MDKRASKIVTIRTRLSDIVDCVTRLDVCHTKQVEENPFLLSFKSDDAAFTATVMRDIPRSTRLAKTDASNAFGDGEENGSLITVTHE